MSNRKPQPRPSMEELNFSSKGTSVFTKATSMTGWMEPDIEFLTGAKELGLVTQRASWKRGKCDKVKQGSWKRQLECHSRSLGCPILDLTTHSCQLSAVTYWMSH